MGKGLGKFLKSGVAVGLGILIASSTIGPDTYLNRKYVSVVSGTKKVVGVYSEREMAQIERFKGDARFVMWARVIGRNWVLNRTVSRMVDDYSEMNRGVREEVRGEMEDSLLYFRNVNGGFPESYEEMVRSLGLNVD